MIRQRGRHDLYRRYARRIGIFYLCWRNSPRIAKLRQDGRFDGDEAFWKTRLSQPEEVKPVKDGQRLRFFLASTGDFTAFKKAASGEVKGTQFTASDGGEEE